MSDLRRKIIDASVAIIAKDGVRALSFREVARQANVSHQAPYHHFENHHGILRAIAKEGFTGLAEAMDEAARKAGPAPLDALHAAGLAYVGFACSHLGHFRVMFQNSLILEERRSEPFAEAENAHGVLLRLASAVQKSGASGKLTVEQLAMISWSLVHGIANLLTEQIPPGSQSKKSFQRNDGSCGVGLHRAFEAVALSR